MTNSIIAAMTEREVTVTQLARLTGLAKSSISNYVNGKNTPREGALQKIADALECSVEFLKTPYTKPTRTNLKNVSIEQAAQMLGKSKQFVRVALQQGIAPYGHAVRISGTKYSYHISPKKLQEYIGG